MLEQYHEKMKIKWWEWFPVIGTMAFSIRFDFWKNNQSKSFRAAVGKYRSIVNLIGFLIGISFLTTFFVLRNKHGYGPYPWFFWTGLAFGLSNNCTVLWPHFLIRQGFKTYDASKDEETLEKDKEAKIAKEKVSDK